MFALALKHAGSGLRVALASFLLVIAAGGGGCTLLAGGELSDKPSEAGGGGGQGGGGGSASASGSSATGGAMCMPDTANCDGLSGNGCEAKLKTDAFNCGSCKTECEPGKHCKESECE